MGKSQSHAGFLASTGMSFLEDANMGLLRYDLAIWWCGDGGRSSRKHKEDKQPHAREAYTGSVLPSRYKHLQCL